MKFLWLLHREIKSNLFSTLLIFLELFFLVIALCICLSLSQRVIGAARFFGRFEGRAVTAAIGNADKKELEAAFDDVSDLAVTVTYYHAKDTSGQTVYLGDYSKSAFTELSLAYSGDMVDTDKEYGEAVPAMVSRTLTDRYKPGSTYSFKGVKVYICGALKDDYLYLLTADMTNEDFLMCCDSKGLLQTLDRSNSANAFLTAEPGCDLLTFRRLLNDVPFVKGSQEFNWKEKLGEDFDRLSGNLMIGVLVLLITLIGFTANNILTMKKNEQAYNFMNMIGLSKPKMTLLFTARQFVSLATAICCVLFFSSGVNAFLGRAAVTTARIFLVGGVFLLLTAGSTVIPFLFHNYRNSLR